MPVPMTVIELALGLLAWGLGFVALCLRKRRRGAEMCSLGSLSCCAASLCVVVFDFARLADLGDVSAFLDTANAFRLAAGTLLVVTLGLNLAAWVLRLGDN